jgi:hypothetical protein
LDSGLPDDSLKLFGKSSGTAPAQPHTDTLTQRGCADGGGDDNNDGALPIESTVATKDFRGEGANQAHGQPNGALGASAPPKLVVEPSLPHGSRRRIQRCQREVDLGYCPVRDGRIQIRARPDACGCHAVL